MKFRYRVLILLFALAIICYLDRLSVAVAGPRIQQELSIPPERWGWVLGAFSFSYALFEIPSGALGDWIGQRKVLARIVLWWSAFTFITGMARSFRSLVAIQLLFGAGEAGAFPNASGAIAKWFPVTQRARAQGVVWMASRVGGAVSPLIVVPLQQRYGWRASFFAFAGLGLVWAAVWFFWYRDHPSQKRGVGKAELEELGEGAHLKPRSVLPFGVAVRSRNLWMILLMYHLYCWGSYFYVSWLPTYLVKGRGFAESRMALFATLPFIIGACANLAGGFISDALVRRYGLRIGRRAVGATGLALAAALMLGAALTTNNVAAALCLAIGYGCMDCMVPVGWAVCLDVGREYAGAVSGSMNMAGQTASFLSAVAFGYMVRSFHSYNAPLIPMAATLFLSAWFFTRIDPSRPIHPS